MHHKIKAYVYFKLRGDQSKDHLEKKEEITSNIIERYDELYEETNDETYAYIEAIKTMGEFLDDDHQEETTYKPVFAEMLLVSATVLSIISLLVTLLNGVAGAILVGMSIALYAVGAVYLYQYSRFVESQEYDIDKYRSFLDKVFSYMKTNFTFWSVSLSLIISQLIYNIVLIFVTLATINSVDLDGLIGAYMISILGFLIVLAIIGSMFISLYRKLMKKYHDLTGHEDVLSVGMKAKQFLGDSSSHQHNIFLNKWFYTIFNIVVMVFILLDMNTTYRWINPEFRGIEYVVIALEGVLFIYYVIVTLLHYHGKIKRRLLLPIMNVILSIVVFIIFVSVGHIQRTYSFIGGLFFIVGIVSIVLLVIDYSLNRDIK